MDLLSFTMICPISGLEGIINSNKAPKKLAIKAQIKKKRRNVQKSTSTYIYLEREWHNGEEGGGLKQIAKLVWSSSNGRVNIREK